MECPRSTSASARRHSRRRKKEPKRALPRLQLKQRGHSNPPPLTNHEAATHRQPTASKAPTPSMEAMEAEAARNFPFPATSKATASLRLSAIRESLNTKEEGKGPLSPSVSLRESDENRPELIDNEWGATDCAADAAIGAQTPLMVHQISAVREEHRLSLGGVPEVTGGSETDDASSTAETEVSYMSDNHYLIEDMDSRPSGHCGRSTLVLEPLDSHSMRRSFMTLDGVCDTVVSPVKGMLSRNGRFPDIGDNPLQIVVNDECGGQRALE